MYILEMKQTQQPGIKLQPLKLDMLKQITKMRSESELLVTDSSYQLTTQPR